ncbi:phospholipid transport system transporter-binding protein [Pseudoalteromonas ulvae UL12]|uniref:Anti-sigma B factor antagonist n=1 Tax=Pseudoalteromonas ulvae TaxID=107327 RepID=A0A244CPL8_PSEDV|nr:STAS domain-containing protein [Pseudoalteromonas ulvae]MBE0364990.1 phospholipid transport system transporter-binding protein [Pseudoalteromonas ulvae UL12]OUL57550.1 anti-sigma B factor antagonist [Pseudoalteromonas ulvae]
MTQLNLELKASGEFVVSGELSAETVANFTFMQKFPDISSNCIIFDLSDVSRVDTAGLAWLIHTLSELQQQNINLSLHHVPEQLQRLMQLVQVSQLFE